MSLLKIVLHATVLFFLMRLRMEPLLSPDWARSLDRLAGSLQSLAGKDDRAAQLLETFESLLPDLQRITGRADSLTKLHQSADREIRELSESFQEPDRLVGKDGQGAHSRALL